MAYQRLLNARVIMAFALAALLVVAVSCGGGAEPTAEPGAPAPTAAAPTQAPAAQAPSQPATAAPAPATRAAPTGATPVPQPQATATPATVATAMAKPEGTLNVGYKDVPPFDGRLSEGGAGAYAIGFSIGEVMIFLNTEGEFVPRLAREWSVSPNGLVWTFKLREGVQFHKGYGEMTADDVIWSFREIGREGSKNSRSSQVRRLWRIEQGGTRALDDYTIEVNTGAPQYDMLNQLISPNFHIMSKNQVDQLGEEEGAARGAATGPWEIANHESSQFWKFRAMEDHWRKPPEFADMVWWHMPEESTRVANFQTGNVDTFAMAMDSLPIIEKVEGTKFMRVPNAGVLHLGFYGNWYVGHGTPEHKEKVPGYDPELPWISSNPDPASEEWKKAAKVRRALSISIDRQAIVDTLLRGEGKPLTLYAWDAHIDGLPPEVQKGWEFNPEKAKQLLEEAGYPDGFELTLTPGIRGIPAEVEATEAIATMWEDIGVRASLNRVTLSTIRPSIQAHTYNQIYTHGSMGGRPDPLDATIGQYASDAGFTFGVDHPRIDEVIYEAIGIVDGDKRLKVTAEIAKFMYENTLGVGLYSVNFVWPLGPRIDSWLEHMDSGDRRNLSSTEYTPHRK